MNHGAIARRVLCSAILLADLATVSVAHDADFSGLPPLLQGVSFSPPLGNSVPLDTEFLDEQGRSVRLRDYFRDRPVLLDLVYFGCPQLCDQSLESLASGLRAVPFRAAADYTVLAVSFDSRDTPASAQEKKSALLARYGIPGGGAGWHFLAGNNPSIAALASAVGFHFVYDNGSKQYAHGSGLLVLTPQGGISRFLPGADFAPRDLKLSMMEASAEKIGTPSDHLLLFCYQYDPASGRYSAAILRLVKWSGILTLFGIAALIFAIRRRGGHVDTVERTRPQEKTC